MRAAARAGRRLYHTRTCARPPARHRVHQERAADADQTMQARRPSSPTFNDTPEQTPLEGHNNTWERLRGLLSTKAP